MNKRIKLIITSIVVASMFSLTGCSLNKNNTSADEAINEAEITSAIKKVTAESLAAKDISVNEDDSEYLTNETSIRLEGKTANAEGNGVQIDAGIITINESGTYTVTGELDDGQIVVNCSDTDKVKIILNGVNITNSKSSAIYVEKADKTIISLADGTENYIEDGETYQGIDDQNNEPDAAIFSKDDLIISGTGKLNVKANYKDGITCKDDLIINSGYIDVDSSDNGIKGKDSVSIIDGNIKINSKGDVIKSTNDSKDEKGYVYIKKGTINISSEMDGIQAENSVVILDGNIDIKSGNGSEEAPQKSGGDMGFGKDIKSSEASDAEETSSDSKKGLKSALSIEINGGIINIDSYDDSIHSNAEVTINSGTVNANSGDDGIHGTSTVDINGGKINIPKSYEGIEGEIITINDGEIHVKSSDDGINAAEASTSDNNSPEDNIMKDKMQGNQKSQDDQMPQDGEAKPQEREKLQDGEMPPDNQKPQGGEVPQDGQMPQNGGMPQEDQRENANEASGEQARGNKQQFAGGGMGGQSSGNAELNINGGYVYVDADGDGLDANGSINIAGGTVIVNGPTNDGNGALDYDVNCKMTGGTLIAAGSSGMLQAPDSTSTQYVISTVFSSNLEAGTSINISSDSGESILTFTPSKKYQSIVVCSPDIQKGSTYTISAGGKSSGNQVDGLYSDGNFGDSKESINCSVSDIVTNAGTQSGRGNGMQGGHGGAFGKGNRNVQNNQ